MSEYLIESHGPQLHFFPKNDGTVHEFAACRCNPAMSSVGGCTFVVHFNKWMCHVRGGDEAQQAIEGGDAHGIPTHDEAVRANITKALDSTHGNKTEAAKILGLKRTTMVEKMKKLGMKLSQ